MCFLGACFCVLLLALLTLSSARRQPFGIHSLFPYNIFWQATRSRDIIEALRYHISSCKGLGTQGSAKNVLIIDAKVHCVHWNWLRKIAVIITRRDAKITREDAMITRGDEIEEKGASVLQAIPSTAAGYTTIGIGERHTGQACVLGSPNKGKACPRACGHDSVVSSLRFKFGWVHLKGLDLQLKNPLQQ
jgi:hypothetical protein